MLLVDLALVGLAAALVGWACRRAGVPEVLGYILAGVILGPHTPPFSFVTDVDAVRAIAGFAVVFRMFSLGLEFDPQRLAGRWRLAAFAGVAEIAACAGAGYVAAPLLDLTRLEGVILGAALGTTSTNILMRALADRGLLARPEARNAAAITIVEDLIAMALLAVLALSRAGQPAPELARDSVELVLFALAAFSAGAIVVPRILDRLARDYADDLLTVGVVATMFLLAGATLTLDAGPAVGAFLSGVVVAGARHAPGVVNRVMPLRDLFSAVFFVSAGMLLDPRLLLQALPVALLATILFVPIKASAVALGARLGGAKAIVSARTGATLAQTGTLGIVVAAGTLLSAERASQLFAYAFIAWASTIALTRLRLERAPDLAERVLARWGARSYPHDAEPATRAPSAASDHVATAVAAFGGAIGFVLIAHHALDPLQRVPGSVPLMVATALLAGLFTSPFLALCARACREAAGIPARALRFSPRGILRAGKSPSASLLVAAAALVPTLAIIAIKLYVVPLEPIHAGVAFALGVFLGDGIMMASPRARDAVIGPVRALLARVPLTLDAHTRDLRSVGPYGTETDVIQLPRARAWRRVSELPLPDGGAKLIAVVRSERLEPQALDPHLELHPGDGIVLVGTPNQLHEARRALAEPEALAARAGAIERSAAP